MPADAARSADFEQWQAAQTSEYKSWLGAPVAPQQPEPVQPPPKTAPEKSKTAPAQIVVPAAPAASVAPAASIAPPMPAKPQPAQPAPPTQAHVSLPAGSTPVSVKLLGAPVVVGVMPGLSTAFVGRLTPNAIAGHFENLASVPGTQTLVETLQALGQQHKLNSWAQVLLLNEVAQQVHANDATSRQMLVWFLALKSGIDMRIGYREKAMQLLLPFTSEVFGASSFEMDKRKYYPIDPGNMRAIPPVSLSSYPQQYEKLRAIDLTFREAVLISGSEASAPRTLTFIWQKQTVAVTINPDPVLIGIYDSVPNTDLSVYLSSVWRSPVRDQLRAQLLPFIAGKSDRDAINFLLRFVQNALPYKTDQEQFRHENSLFPDQTLFYPFSDCEDRSILFAALVRDLLGLPVIGLVYPGHVTTAVLIPTASKDDTIEWKGKRYVIADPTYTDANVGMAIPELKTAAVRVVEVSSN